MHRVEIDELLPWGCGIMWAATCRTCGWWGDEHEDREKAEGDKMMHEVTHVC